MKKISFILLILSSCLNAQIATVEHVYSNASTFNAPTSRGSQLMIVDFEVSGKRYVHINRVSKVLNIYSLSHVLVKSVSLSALPTTSSYDQLGDFLYFSEQLFVTDSKMEFMYVVDQTDQNGNMTFFTGIYDEDGVLLFSDSGAPLIRTNYEQLQYPIYNTPLGTKMLLSYVTGDAKVFNLQGILPCRNPCEDGFTTAINSEHPTIYNALVSTPFPNPTSGSTSVEYQLPRDISEGDIVFYDTQGKEVKRFKVTNAFTTLNLSTDDLSSGTYYYQLLVNETIVTEGKKMIVVK